MSLAKIESLDHEGRGVAHVDGKTIFIEGALPGECVEYTSFRKKPNYEQATLSLLLSESSQRVDPRCPHFSHCGGCSMQHLDIPGQTAAKQRVLEDALWHVGKLRAEQMFPPIQGAAWGYRHRARLSVRLVPKKGGVLVGFHERRSSYVAVMDSCAVLPPLVSRLIPELKRLVASLATPDRLPQIEVAVGDRETALVLRHLEPLSDTDLSHLKEFADVHRVVWYLQPKGPDSAHRFHPPGAADLTYRLDDWNVTMGFSPTEFTQVNHGVNAMLVRRAMELLRPAPGERIIDLFCGLGNFTLPIARCGAQVLGIEGSQALVARAELNARRNDLEKLARFEAANLFEITPESWTELADRYGGIDKLLIDPPRDGAVDVVKALPSDGSPRRIVYVSCSPATLARDAAILVHEKGYHLRGAGIACMFPHTSHVESVALFEWVE